jgi:hypothetical protein
VVGEKTILAICKTTDATRKATRLFVRFVIPYTEYKDGKARKHTSIAQLIGTELELAVTHGRPGDNEERPRSEKSARAVITVITVSGRPAWHTTRE